MYLKSIELAGFKSFANRTKLAFEPGMSAIVGPNGCGKSNISDAVRWVLGEQSAKALRGGAMTDVIFAGTDKRKPVGMAEVSLTLAECEEALGTDYNEVTVTRRVLRSGEGQYYINKAPCRLKDIQRLFMDTGVGTNSYSMMEQGKIDQILSSRPDDRRAIFEEASGITKYKADKKEAMRKLDHTEANLLRVADIIKEVKRQIISLQRQAGKARRYQSLHAELRAFDLCAARHRLDELAATAGLLEAQLASLSEQDESVREEVRKAEEESGRCRADLAKLEQTIGETMESSIQAKTELGRVQEMAHLNADRIKELETLSARETRDADEAMKHIEDHRQSVAGISAEHAKALEAHAQVEQELAQRRTRLTELDEGVARLQEKLESLRNESLTIESRMAALQNERSELEANEKGSVIRRERLAAEQAQMQRAVEGFSQREEEMRLSAEALRSDVARKEAFYNELNQRREHRAQTEGEYREACQELQAQVAARRAQIELLQDADHQTDGFPPGARWLLDPEGGSDFGPDRVLGPLAGKLQAHEGYQAALEVAVRPWLDAVVVRDLEVAHQVLLRLREHEKGAARLLAAEAGAPLAPVPDGPGTPLLDHVHCDAPVRPLAERLLQGIRVLEEDEAPTPDLAPGLTLVSRDGQLLAHDGRAERWSAEATEVNPLGRQHTLRRWEQELETLEARLQAQQTALESERSESGQLDRELAEARLALEESRRNLALREGENQVVSQEAHQARERRDTVAFELNALVDQDGGADDRRQTIQAEQESLRNRQAEVRTELTAITQQHREQELERTEVLAGVTDQRIALSEKAQQVENCARRLESTQARIQELEKLSQERQQGVDSYRQRMVEISQQVEEAQGRQEPLQQAIAQHEKQLQTSRESREGNARRLTALDESLHTHRERLEEVRNEKTRLEVQLAEERMRRQTLLDRVTSDYHLAPEAVAEEPEPDWGEGPPLDREALETRVAEIRAKLESMGSVNLVAIEEHQELEERYAFLTQEHDDLLSAKQQLMEMVRKINKTTTELFSETFNKVNENFQVTFKKLFGGGSAKLVLLDEEDILESGIEIIARPPGKKLQTVSLLSGGERTMTAVALLFALYIVKPSPFCVLDELDAALDDANIGRFVSILQGFLEGSQFVVISHNRQTISAADVLYGITMEEGVSGIVSVKFSDHIKEDRRSDAAAGATRNEALAETT